MPENRSELMKRKEQILSIKDLINREIECCKWSVEYIKDYEKKPYPTRPKEVDSYYALPEQTRKEMNNPENEHKYKSFWLDPVVHTYFDSMHRIKEFNTSNLLWLKQMKEVLKGLGHDSVIDKAIATHEGGQKVEWEE